MTERPDILNTFYKIFDSKTIDSYLKHYPNFQVKFLPDLEVSDKESDTNLSMHEEENFNYYRIENASLQQSEKKCMKDLFFDS